MQDDIPMPPSHGCIVFHTPNEPSRIRCPMPNSMRNNGMPSSISMTKNGIRNAPETIAKGKIVKNKRNKMVFIPMKIDGNNDSN